MRKAMPPGEALNNFYNNIIVYLNSDELKYLLFVVKGDIEVISDPNYGDDVGDRYTSMKVWQKLQSIDDALHRMDKQK